MWKRLFGRRHVEKSTLSTQTYIEDLFPEETKILTENSMKLMKLYKENTNKKFILISPKLLNKNSSVIKPLTENQGSGSSSVIKPEVSESGNQTNSHATNEHGIQTEREPPSANLLRCEVGNQTELTNGGRGEVLQVEDVMSYDTPLDNFRNQHPIVTPAELLQALQELAMQQAFFAIKKYT